MAATPDEHPSTTSTFPTRQKPLPYSFNNGQRTPLSSILPPLVFGTATFNYQYSHDPFALDTTGLVTSALTHGIRAFDTSPYYGPSEQLLGDALATPFVRETFPRSSYMILTKVGRIAAEEFDYSASWVRQSVLRSLQRLHTDYLDLVYCHDIEFVSAAETLEAVRTLRTLRDEGKIRYVGISGYPLDVLGSTAELILRETGEPIDCVQSYAHFTLQNQALASPTLGLPRFQAAGVQVVTNASTLGMGLLRRQGVPIAALGDFHPAPPGLRAAVRQASSFCDAHGERIEVIALRWALETWSAVGAACGSRGDPASGLPWISESNSDVGGAKMGVSVIGVSNAQELEKTMLVWRSILDGLEGGEETARKAGRWSRAWEWSCNRRKAVCLLAEGVQEILGSPWFGYSWASPEPGFVNKRALSESDAAAATTSADDVESADQKEYISPPQSPEASATAAAVIDQPAQNQALPLR
ncbi:unnamed protein product [Periconia digitata]|uniref:NADP-dependent oxidoreductase domain-containing protein n=1 Tax=Periconia digitata TaxID=1303443 RepID=A0A9W4UQH5_9PLEO|nr:unnamed protein product [Periconia digitata]